MQPLKILAFAIGAIPIAAFLLTLFLTNGAPLRPFTPGEESRPAAATRALPQAKPERANLERQGSVAAAGFQKADGRLAGNSDAEGGFLPGGDTEPAFVVNRDRDVQLFMTLFGAPHAGLLPPP